MNEGGHKNTRGKKKLLLYFYPVATSFIEQDTIFFREHFIVKVFSFLPAHKLLLPVSFIKQKIFLLLNIRSASIIVCQFAGYQSLLPVLFGRMFKKPCLIVVGGTDCVSFPSINYGNLRKPLLRWFTLKSLKYATHITAPSEPLIENKYTYHNKDFPSQGFRYFDPSIKTPVTIIHNGIDTSRFKPVTGAERRVNTFLTICNNIDKRNYFLKGLDLFIEMAKKYQECEFTIIGKIQNNFRIEKPFNVTFIDFIPNEQLPAKMSEFTFYCQLSMSEGFGVALAEAMAAGCVPIVSRVGILDQITGDSGFVLEEYDPGLLKTIADSALKADTMTLSRKARARIVKKFNNDIRNDAFKKLIDELIKK